MWVPTARTSTEESRGKLPASVSLADATFNVGRTALLVAAIAAGDTSALRSATADRLHQDIRLAAAPESRRAMDAAVEAGAWCVVAIGIRPDDRGDGRAGRRRETSPPHCRRPAKRGVLGLDHQGAVIDRS